MISLTTQTIVPRPVKAKKKKTNLTNQHPSPPNPFPLQQIDQSNKHANIHYRSYRLIKQELHRETPQP